MHRRGSGLRLARQAPVIATAVAALLASSAWTSAAQTSPDRPAAAAQCPAKAAQPPISDPLSVLDGVAVRTSCDAWAVGQATAEPLNPRFWAVALHWNGRSWQRYRIPAPKKSTSSELTAVQFVSGSQVWAVGDSRMYAQVRTLLA